MAPTVDTRPGLPARAAVKLGLVRVAAAAAMSFALALGARPARADVGRLLVATSDPALVSALSVAVSSRGLSVVEVTELPESAPAPSDIVAARREVAAHDAVAIVWLCDDDAGANALCFCDRTGRFVARPVTVTPPLAPADAAALALSVKLLLWGVRPAPPPPSPVPPAVVVRLLPPQVPPPLVVERLPPQTPPPRTAPPALAVELAGGARVPSSGAARAGLRLGARGAYSPRALGGVWALGAAVTGGPALTVTRGAASAAARTVNDTAAGLFARGRRALGVTALELDVGPSLHVVSADAGATDTHHADLALDALMGVVVPWRRAFVAARVGGFVVVTSPSRTGASPSPDLARWNVEGTVCLGLTFF